MFIHKNNTERLMNLIQKVCFYKHYKSKYEFKFETAKLLYTNIIEADYKGKKVYVCLFRKPTVKVKNDNIHVFYIDRRKSKKYDYYQFSDGFYEDYGKWIKKICENPNDFNVELKELLGIKNTDRFNNDYSEPTLDKGINEESKEESNEESYINKLSECLYNKKSSCLNFIEVVDDKFFKLGTKRILWILYQALFLSPSALIRSIGLDKCFKYYSFPDDNDNDNDEKTQKQKNRYEDRLKGKIFFSVPKKLNDELDINIFMNYKGERTDKYRNFYRVFCSTRKYDIRPMWAHYANNSTGFCVEYSSESVIKGIKAGSLCSKYLIFVGDVIYLDTHKFKKISIRPARRKNKLQKYFKLAKYIRAAFIKEDSWSYEKEFRFVIFSDFKDKTGIEVQADVNCFYLGDKVSTTDRKDLKQKIGNKTVKELTLDSKSNNLIIK